MWMPEYLGKEGNKLLKLMKSRRQNPRIYIWFENEEEILPTILSPLPAGKSALPSTDAVKDARWSPGEYHPK